MKQDYKSSCNIVNLTSVKTNGLNVKIPNNLDPYRSLYHFREFS